MVIQPLNLRGATMENEELRKLQLYQLDILKEVDIDLTTKETYEKVFHFIEEKVQELKKLLESGEE